MVGELPRVSRIPDDLISRRQAATIPRTYQAAIPAAIAEARFTIDTDLATQVEDATRAVMRLDDYATRVFNNHPIAPLAAVLLRTESAASSQIEHLTVGARQLAMAEIALAASTNAELVAGNVATMQAAIRLATELDAATILTMHAVLMGQQKQSRPGRWRETQVWIGGGVEPGRSRFRTTGARPGAIRDDLTAFLARFDIPAMVQAAIAYA